MPKNTNDIRKELAWLWAENKLAENNTFEILNASFIADEPAIFGNVNTAYAQCEIDWYETCSLKIEDIPCKVPQIWKDIASTKGEINSNYGWCIFHKDNHYQFMKALSNLVSDKNSRQATLIYTRPSMHEDACRDGMKDFMCTYGTQFIIRNNTLHHIVYMRSNDAVFGYKNDRYWQNYVFDMMLKELRFQYPELKKGHLYWNAASLHVYERHFHLIEEYSNETV